MKTGPILLLLAIASGPILTPATAQAPAWWASSGAVDSNLQADDYRPANIGQLKHMASKAAAELNSKLSGGAGAEINNLITSWTQPAASGVTRDDYAVLTQGQLKSMAKLFYDRLMAEGYASIYPWTPGTGDDDSYAAVNLGQLKYVFSFDTSITPIKSRTPGILSLPEVGDHALRIISPTVLELERITDATADNPDVLNDWDFVNATGSSTSPAASKFSVKVDGQAAQIQTIGFRRRVRFAHKIKADLEETDQRLGNYLYIKLSTPIPDGKIVTVINSDHTLWPSSLSFSTTCDPSRISPAIHVNQEGYVPGLPKKAMVGYYLGNLGELPITSSTFQIVDTSTNTVAYSGSLTARPDVGYTYTPTPYQGVLQADFSALTTPGEYKLAVPGLGVSLPFLINEGVSMAFARTYALGLYHQRCGSTNALPFTRHTHDACHTALVEVPSPQSEFETTWGLIYKLSHDWATAQTPPDPRYLNGEASLLYPYLNKNPINTSGGHHDAGDYSKYTTNVAQLIHTLIFTVDSIGGAYNLDNLGIPESGNGISDILEEAKIETDFLAKLQDTDGGFYFLVYPKNRHYELDVLPDHGDPQVVFPKTTASTAAAAAALAQAASSPRFKAAYPAAAAQYLNQAKQGWQFVMNALASHTSYDAFQAGSNYGSFSFHNDEIAWAACELYLATGESAYAQQLAQWFPEPSDNETYQDYFQRLNEAWGNAIRSYAFGARSGRVSSSQLDPSYLAKCENEILAAGDDTVTWCAGNAYGTPFPPATKAVGKGGWYFSLNRAADAAAAYQLNPKASYLDAIVSSMNYEAGTNPLSLCYLSGVGTIRPRQMVNHYAINDRRALAPAGIPIGNIRWRNPANPSLATHSFPSEDFVSARYPVYDRWTDEWNQEAEFITLQQARALMSLAVVVNTTATKTQPWTPVSSPAPSILVPTATAPVGQPIRIRFAPNGLDLTNARILWEGRDQNPQFGESFVYTARNNGPQWVELEITWPDGRRVVATGDFTADSNVVNWIDDSFPEDATAQTNNDSWTWVSSNPSPLSGRIAHQTNDATATGIKEHEFLDTKRSPLLVAAGDELFAYVYLDPTNPPAGIMLHWKTADSNEHRAFWGADLFPYGTGGTAGHFNMGNLPPVGQWIRLSIPASVVDLEGKAVTGMCFSVYSGRATWDLTGKAKIVPSP